MKSRAASRARKGNSHDVRRFHLHDGRGSRSACAPLTSTLSYPQGSAVDPIYDIPEECRSAAAKEQANFTHDMIQGGDIAICMGKPGGRWQAVD